MAKTLVTTPRGVAVYPFLNRADVKYNKAGVYRVKVRHTQAEAADLIEQIDAGMTHALQEQKKAEKSPAKRKRIKMADAPYQETDDGHVEISFKQTASGKRDDGSKWVWRPTFYDGQANPILPAALPQIGGGSVIKVGFEIREFYVASLGAGVSLRLKTVQLIQLVEYGGVSVEEAGFVAEEGGFDITQHAGVSPDAVTGDEDEDEEGEDEPDGDEDAEQLDDF